MPFSSDNAPATAEWQPPTETPGSGTPAEIPPAPSEQPPPGIPEEPPGPGETPPEAPPESGAGVRGPS